MKKTLLIAGLMIMTRFLTASAEVDPNFYVYLCFGQSNMEGYLNSQPATGWCSFILGLEKRNGQDMENGAVWEISYTEGKGFSLKNVGTGLYLQDASPARYDKPTYFSFCTLSATATGISTINYTPVIYDDAIYDLNGRRVNESTLRPGIYIKNRKKIVIK